MRTDALAYVLREVGDDSTAEAKALWHAIVVLEDWAEADLLVTAGEVRTLLAKVEGVLARHLPTYPERNSRK